MYEGESAKSPTVIENLGKSASDQNSQVGYFGPGGILNTKFHF